MAKGNPKAKRAMALMRSKGITLKAAWRIVKGGDGASPKPGRRPRSSNKSRSSGVRHTTKSKGLFGLPIPKAGELIQAVYVARQFGALDALDMVTNQELKNASGTPLTMDERLNAAGNIIVGKVTSLGNIVTTLITGYILNVGIKMGRKVGGKHVKKWL